MSLAAFFALSPVCPTSAFVCCSLRIAASASGPPVACQKAIIASVAVSKLGVDLRQPLLELLGLLGVAVVLGALDGGLKLLAQSEQIVDPLLKLLLALKLDVLGLLLRRAAAAAGRRLVPGLLRLGRVKEVARERRRRRPTSSTVRSRPAACRALRSSDWTA